MNLWRTQPILRRGAAFAAVALIAAVALSCGGGTPPFSNPTPTPTNAPTSTPTTPPIGPASCSIGKGSTDAVCEGGHPATLQAQVNAAINDAVAQHPEYFDKTQALPEGSTQYKVVDVNGYFDAVIEKLRTDGFCAEREPYLPNTHMIHVKNVNDLSEDYAIYNNGKGYIRLDRNYIQTCTPSSFPVDPDPNAPPPEIGCGRPFPPPPGSGTLRFGCKVNTHGTDYSILDSTVQVADPHWCQIMMDEESGPGTYDGRGFCPVRILQGPERIACEGWLTGKALDTGVAGPTWTNAKGEYCAPAGSVLPGQVPPTGCAHDPANVSDVRVYNNGAGLYTVSSPTIPRACTVLADR